MEHIASIRQSSCMQFNYPSAQFSTGSVLQKYVKYYHIHIVKFSYLVWVQTHDDYGWLLFSQLSELDYHTVADETMESLTEKFEDIGDTLPCDPEYDAQYSVLTVIWFNISSNLFERKHILCGIFFKFGTGITVHVYEI